MANGRRHKRGDAGAKASWSIALASTAARRGEALDLARLAVNAGFSNAPRVTFVVRRPVRPRPPLHELPPRLRGIADADEPSVIMPFDPREARALA